MNSIDIRLSVSQINKMKHAIGFDNTAKTKNGTYIAFRNYYVSDKDDDWEKLVSLGLAISQTTPLCPMDIAYHLTQKGFETIGQILNIKIKELA